MNLKLQFASLVTLGILSGFVLAIVLAIAYVLVEISWPLVIAVVILYNFLIWLIGPYVNDVLYRWFYRIKFYDYTDVKHQHYAKFLKKVCDKYSMPFPKIGIISDKNPTAFTYGSAAFNARIVMTEGLFHFLDEHEIEAVLAHELGHIKNHDFIIMTIAATLLQILYELYVILTRSRRQSSSYTSYGFGKKGKKGDGRALLYLIGWTSYLFYWIGVYIILFLSRMREYYADEFSAKETGNSNALSSALIKIAYGIASVPDTERTAHLLNNTRAQGIFDIKAAHNFGLIAANSEGKKGPLENALLYDLVNPWAWLHELKSTHPLTGKRIRRLGTLSKKPIFDFSTISTKHVDKARLWRNFWTDFFVICLFSLSSYLSLFLPFHGLFKKKPCFLLLSSRFWPF